VPTNPLERYFEQNQGPRIHKWMHYFDIYHRHLKKFRDRPVVLVEFGVAYGGSGRMWREYLGPDAVVHGVDIDPRCKAWEDAGFTVHIGDQADRSFLRQLLRDIGPIDIVIEDGGHRPDQQIATFEVIYPKVRPGGVFLIEDLHTSYWPAYEGGLGRPGTFMEYAKGLTDQLNAFHSREAGFAPDRFTRTTTSMHYYDSVIVFEKGRVTKPHHEKRGVEDWNPDAHPPFEYSAASRARAAARRSRRRIGRPARKALERLRLSRG
jgi:hypothetical protein